MFFFEQKSLYRLVNKRLLFISPYVRDVTQQRFHSAMPTGMNVAQQIHDNYYLLVVQMKNSNPMWDSPTPIGINSTKSTVLMPF